MESVSATSLRIILIAIGVLILIGIAFFARPRGSAHARRLPFRRGGPRVEPVLGDTGDAAAAAADAPRQGELEVAAEHALGATVPAGPAATLTAGRRPRGFAVDKIVTLYVAAPEGEPFSGADIAVAAEKAGLQFGHMRIFHRLLDGRPEAGAVFSMANMVKPGYFDLQQIAALATPGLSFFMALPGPLAALDAWDAMLPTAQRVAELLGGELRDEAHSALGRQRIAGLRDELRDWDRHHIETATQSPRRG